MSDAIATWNPSSCVTCAFWGRKVDGCSKIVQQEERQGLGEPGMQPWAHRLHACVSVRATPRLLVAVLSVGLIALRVSAAEVRLVEVVPGEALRVTLSGSGQPVVLLPGWFASAFGFRGLSERLSGAGYRSIV